MDRKDQKTPDTETEAQVEVSGAVDDTDLDVVTGGVFRGVTEGPTDPCITNIG